MNEKGMDAVGLKILDLPQQFRFGKIVVPEPEGRLRKLVRRIEPPVRKSCGSLDAE